MTYKQFRLSTSILMSLLILSGCTDNDPETEPEDTVEEMPQEETQDNDEADIDDGENNETEEEGNHSEEDEEVKSDEPAITIDMEEDLLDPDSIKVLVNKQYALPEDYAPDDLVTVEVPTVLENPEIRQLREVASEALTDMFAAAEEDGIILYARSGYRSYQTQVELFNNYVSNHGEEAANRYSARPGESEHQTGLAMDVTSESVNYQLTEAFGETAEGQWVEENAHDFGYIIRYLEGEEEVTGYQYEPWHLRYLGEELAADVAESGLTYEEYLLERGIDIEIDE
ncbi:M15 family metallopeptidase [Alkalibacterium pelagium]|uniref:D-alanyl-D-alanine carboxypeptidase n=1 Tax=Alkalibacterium pelagium TaxID=426702 RepID=A0A1H7FEV7_9LACT|nr:M15 family metallopeptidase [Alkalibacterium pelagium]GEN49375.1 putative carboxypeptidase YodJ [Alkalibacterium pelagium]SEK24713.1 D-alanyl-D-alanine carboxypeptidase [Alkalibacterium pelagium]